MKKNLLLILVLVVAGIVAYAAISSGPFFKPAPANPTVVINLVAGELSAARFGFAIEGQALESPGPTIRVKVGDVVQVNFKNVGGPLNQPHTFVIVSDGGTIVFSARVGTANEPIDVGKGGKTTFVADRAGEYVYMCQVPGHRVHGQWGKFIVER